MSLSACGERGPNTLLYSADEDTLPMKIGSVRFLGKLSLRSHPQDCTFELSPVYESMQFRPLTFFAFSKRSYRPSRNFCVKTVVLLSQQGLYSFAKNPAVRVVPITREATLRWENWQTDIIDESYRLL